MRVGSRLVTEHLWWVALGAAVVGVSGCEKARLDEEVRQLCAKDGGIKVYEVVTLPRERFDKFGVVDVPPKDRAKPTDEYFYEWDITYYKKGNPEMSRDHFKLIRRSDGKLLAEAISYSRRGGDIPGPWHDSYFRCPADAGGSGILGQRVFKQGTTGR